MNSCLYEGFLTHLRITPRKHGFRYKMTLFCIDLDELPTLTGKFWEIAYNRLSLFSLNDGDHLPSSENSSKALKQKALEYLASKEPDLKISKVWLICHLKMWGHVFNPASFYYFFDKENKLAAAMIEVNNTFGEIKNYYVPLNKNNELKTKLPKFFYISPFSELENELSIKLKIPGQKVKMVVNEKKASRYFFFSHFFGVRKEISHLNLFLFFLKNPLNNFAVSAGIHIHAILLWLKKVPYFSKKQNPELQRDLYGKK